MARCALPVTRGPFGYDQGHGDPGASHRDPALDHADGRREDPRADGRGARRRHDGVARRDPGRRLLRLPVRPRVRHGRRRKATWSSRSRASPSSSTPSASRTSRAPRSTSSRGSRSPGSRSTTRTPPPRAAAATPSRWKRARRATTPPLPRPAAAAPAARTEPVRSVALMSGFSRTSGLPHGSPDRPTPCDTLSQGRR